jgi:release factor glutamine methyltransferase
MPPEPTLPRLFELLQHAQQQGLARIDAQLLLLHACERPAQDRAWLLAHDQDHAAPAQLARWHEALARRLSGEPVAYITGFKAFYGLNLHITPAVLDPRDDTETLVDWALELLPPDQACKVLDLGTGSGAIALALASQRPKALVSATDASSAALQVAQANAQALGLNVNFIQANAQAEHWLACLGHGLQDDLFDLIVSNPPYIADGDAHLAALKHEPSLALTSGADGLDAIRSITAHAGRHLKPGGWLLLEHGYDQAPHVQALLAAQGFAFITTRPDLAGVARCTGAQRRSL